jgi:thiol:disulfide interchange protein DsbD
VPKKFITDYGFGVKEAGFGYETSVIHPMTITPPATLTPGQKITLSGKAGWLMCDPNTCVPGKADLSITLEVGAAAASSPEATAIDAAVAKLPSPVAAPMKAALEGTNVVLTATIPAGAIPEGAKLAFHPLKNQVLDPFADPTVTVAGETVTISAPKHESLTAAPAEFAGVLAVELPAKKTGFELSTSGVTAVVTSTSTEPATPAADPDITPEPASAAASASASAPEELPFGGGLFGVLLAAFLGGIILNVMPCVFPVISLKVMSFVGQAARTGRRSSPTPPSSRWAFSSSSGGSRS